MKNNFVPYESALKLKELGFDEECIAFSYVESGHGFKENEIYLIDDWEDLIWNHTDTDYFYARPTYEQVFNWFREKHNLHVESIWDVIDSKLVWFFGISFIGDTINDSIDTPHFSTYEEAKDEVLKIVLSLGRF